MCCGTRSDSRGPVARRGLWVTDNGPGTDPSYHERLFGIFQTLVPGEHQEGTGIGLGLVKQIAEGYAGTAELGSGIGPGRIF